MRKLDGTNTYTVKFQGFDGLFIPKYVLAQVFVPPTGSISDIMILGVIDEDVEKDSPVPAFI